ncbi:MAG: hypothetical protein ACLSHU_02660 [Oscillospiraceae bacterium]
MQKLHGSHVIIPWTGVQPPDDTITQAAQLAAWFSQGRQGQNVAVDVTPVRFVKSQAAPSRAWWSTPNIAPSTSPRTPAWPGS